MITVLITARSTRSSSPVGCAVRGYATEVLAGSTPAATLASPNAASRRHYSLRARWPASGRATTPIPRCSILASPSWACALAISGWRRSWAGGGAAAHREYGAAVVQKTAAGRLDPLTARLSPSTQVWMSHGDSVVALPPGAACS